MTLTTLNALSPLDGRYQTKLDALRPYFSECALIKHRAWVEVEWLKALAAAPDLQEIVPFSAATISELARVGCAKPVNEFAHRLSKSFTKITI